MKLTLGQLLKGVVENNASDLHITVGSPPVMRVNGKILRIKSDDLTSKDTKELCYGVLTDSQKLQFEQDWELDFSFGLKGMSRFRGNIFYQRGSVAGAFRRIPFQIPKLEDLQLPPVVTKMINSVNGLVLVTGPTGAGKSTTLAAVIDYINDNKRSHIITLEDPIEFMHFHKQSIVNQREITSDSKNFLTAIKNILRQDPDYVLVGELRDKESMEMALTIAETGHLVFGTLHTNSAIQSVSRLVNTFPKEAQPQIRNLLSHVLVGVISQRLITVKSKRRALVLELLYNNPAIKNIIREGKEELIYSNMQSNQQETGMITMNQSLKSLIDKNEITLEEAIGYTTMHEELLSMCEKGRRI